MIRAAIRLVPYGLRSKIKSIPGVAQLQRKVVAQMDGEEFVHRVDAGPAKGVRFLIRMPEDKGIWTGSYEQEFADHVALGVPKGGVCYDIGGWHGYFTGIMAAQGAGRVVTFEPLPGNIARIRKLIELNPDLPVTLKTIALSDANGTGELLIMPDTSMAKLSTSEFQKDVVAVDKVEVQLVTLDSLVAAGEAPPPDLIKIDVEGAELMVLKGAREVLAASKPTIYAEVHSPALMEEVRALLESIGYRIDHLDGGEPSAQRPDGYQIRASAR